MQSETSDDTQDQRDDDIVGLFGLDDDESDQARRDDVDQCTHQSSTDEDIQNIYILIIHYIIDDIKHILYSAESQSDQNTENNQIAFIGLFAGKKHIIPHGIFHILFCIRGYQIIEEQDVDPGKHPSVSERYEK